MSYLFSKVLIMIPFGEPSPSITRDVFVLLFESCLIVNFSPISDASLRMMGSLFSLENLSPGIIGALKNVVTPKVSIEIAFSNWPTTSVAIFPIFIVLAALIHISPAESIIIPPLLVSVLIEIASLPVPSPFITIDVSS